jgi:hypothetical protein
MAPAAGTAPAEGKVPCLAGRLAVVVDPLRHACIHASRRAATAVLLGLGQAQLVGAVGQEEGDARPEHGGQVTAADLRICSSVSSADSSLPSM